MPTDTAGGPRTPRVPKPHCPRLRHTETPCQCESTRLPKPPFPVPNVAFRTGKEESFTPNLKGPRIHLPKPHGPRLRHTETPCQCESTRLPKPPFPLPNVAFRTDKKNALRRTWKAHVYICQGPRRQSPPLPNPMPTRTSGATLRHSQTPLQCESTRLPKPPFPLPNVAFRTDKKKALRRTWKAHVYTCQSPTAPGSATPKPHASASRHGCRNHPFHCLTLLLEPIRKKLYAELERPTYTLAKAPRPQAPPHRNPMPVRVDTAAETTLSTA